MRCRLQGQPRLWGLILGERGGQEHLALAETRPEQLGPSGLGGGRWISLLMGVEDMQRPDAIESRSG